MKVTTTNTRSWPASKSRWPGAKAEYATMAVVFVVLISMPWWAPSSVITLGNYSLIYALAGIGLSLLMGLAGQVSLGQAAFFAIGAYTQAVMVTKFGWGVLPSVVVSVGLAAFLAGLLGVLLLRLRGHYLALATLGLGIIVGVGANESTFLGSSSGIFGIPKPEIFGQTYRTPVEFYLFLVPLVMIGLLLSRNIVHSRVGRALGAVNDSEVAAESLGVDTFRYRVQVFVISAGYAATAGAVYAHFLGVVNPGSAGFSLSVKFLLMVVLGGLGSVWGALIGAFAVEFLEEGLGKLIPLVIPGAVGEVQLIGFGIVLVLVIMLQPGGIHGSIGAITRRLKRAPAVSVEDEEEMDVSVTAEQIAALLARPDRPQRGAPLLKVRGLTKRFGGLTAVNNVDLEVHAGEIVALIGPNGAGKTTCFNMISGVLPPTSGEVEISGRRIEGKKPHVFAEARATRTFQNLQIFSSSSVRFNVLVGRHLRTKAGLWRAAFVFPALAEERRVREAADDYIHLLGLTEDRNRRAADLPFGRQRLVEVARALALEPDLLMLDEPLAGLSGAERRAFAKLLRACRDAGMSVLIVEHDVDAVLALADRVVVLDDGHRIATGTPDEIRVDAAVLAAYLGMDEEEVPDQDHLAEFVAHEVQESHSHDAKESAE